MNFMESFLQFYNNHRWGIHGACIGLVMAVAFLLLGFFKMLFILFFMGVGYYIGKRLHEDRDYIKNLLDRVLPPGTYR